MRKIFQALLPLTLLVTACVDSNQAPASCEVDGKSYESGTTGIVGPGGCPACQCDDGKLACDDIGCGPQDEAPCTVAGKTYESGAKGIPAADGCNTCTCDEGELTCTVKSCPGGEHCEQDGVSYAPGDDVPTDCGACTCTDLGIECLAIACPTTCVVEEVEYQPGDLISVDSDGCNKCSCGEDGEVECTDEPCPEEGTVACVVGGVEYRSGEGGIKDPFSCNTCNCFNGELLCTDVGCEEPCPPNSAPSTSCARCGPTDGCLAVETGCFVVCDQNADDVCDGTGHSYCENGLCRSVCG